jgi:hypothetical protein
MSSIALTVPIKKVLQVRFLQVAHGTDMEGDDQDLVHDRNGVTESAVVDDGVLFFCVFQVCLPLR